MPMHRAATHPLCPHCGEPVLPDERQKQDACRRRWHLECLFRAVVGGVNHLEGRCSCYGGDRPGECRDPDPPGLSPREAARTALAWWDNIR